MKNKLYKFNHLNIIVIIILFMVGFSPQINILKNFNPFIVNAASAMTEDTDYIVNVDSYLNKNGISGASATDVSNNVKNSISNLASYLNSINSFLIVLANSVSVIIIILTGYKFMRDSSGNLVKFIQTKEDIKDALICVCFICIIPWFVKGVLEFKLPTSTTATSVATYGDVDMTIANTSLIPKSALVDYLGKFDIKSVSPVKINLDTTKSDSTESTGLQGVIVKVVLFLINAIIYYPLKLVASLLGLVSFYPVSFDPDLYSSSMATIIATPYSSCLTNVLSSFNNGDVSTSISNALLNFTNIVNLLYYVIKKFCITAIDLICYYYGISHLLKKNKTPVDKFLINFGEGLFGMIIAPYIIQFMIDVDAMVSTSILSLTSKGVPGLALLSLLPSSEDTQKTFLALLFGILIAIVLIKLCKAFFVRRLELTVNYIIAPAVFLMHIANPQSNSVSRWFSNVSTSAFLTTTYAPLFAIVTLLISISSSVSLTTPIASLFYYTLIIGVMWFAGPAANTITSLFGFNGRSVAADMAKKGVSDAFNTASDVSKVVGGAALVGGAAAAVGAGKTAIRFGAGAAEGFKNADKGVANKGWQTLKGGLNASVKNPIKEKWDKAKYSAQSKLLKGKESILKTDAQYKTISDNREQEFNDLKNNHNLSAIGADKKDYEEFENTQQGLSDTYDNYTDTKVSDNKISEDVSAKVNEFKTEADAAKKKAEDNKDKEGYETYQRTYETCMQRYNDYLKYQDDRDTVLLGKKVEDKNGNYLKDNKGNYIRDNTGRDGLIKQMESKLQSGPNQDIEGAIKLKEKIEKKNYELQHSENIRKKADINYKITQLKQDQLSSKDENEKKSIQKKIDKRNSDLMKVLDDINDREKDTKLNDIKVEANIKKELKSYSENKIASSSDRKYVNQIQGYADKRIGFDKLGEK